MKCNDKLTKLEENLTKRAGIDPDDGMQYFYGYFLKGEIYMGLVQEDVELGPIKEAYNKNWTLKDWKQFRDRCLLELR
jgi:hypothetical protein